MKADFQQFAATGGTGTEGLVAVNNIECYCDSRGRQTITWLIQNEWHLQQNTEKAYLIVHFFKRISTFLLYIFSLTWKKQQHIFYILVGTHTPLYWISWGPNWTFIQKMNMLYWRRETSNWDRTHSTEWMPATITQRKKNWEEFPYFWICPFSSHSWKKEVVCNQFAFFFFYNSSEFMLFWPP